MLIDLFLFNIKKIHYSYKILKGQRRVLIKVRHFTAHSRQLLQYIDYRIMSIFITATNTLKYFLFSCWANLQYSTKYI